jgi:hypothetical protein
MSQEEQVKPNRFELTINLRNDMRTTNEIATTLRHIADQIAALRVGEFGEWERNRGIIRDTHRNVIGNWERFVSRVRFPRRSQKADHTSDVFTLTIRLGSDSLAMGPPQNVRTVVEVSDALRATAGYIVDIGDTKEGTWHLDAGNVRDRDGRIVGSWEIRNA